MSSRNAEHERDGAREMNVAARAGRWSARHWKLAVFGWLAFAVAAMVVGSAVGLKEVADADTASGETATAQKMLSEAAFESPASEQVLIQSRAGTFDSPQFRSVVRDVVKRVGARPEVTNLVSPLNLDGGGQVSADRRSALVAFDMRGDPDTASERVEPVLAAVEAAQRAHPDFFIAGFGSASAGYELDATMDKDLRRAELLSLPITLVILVVAFGALVAAGLPVILAFSGVLAAMGISALISQAVPASDSTASVILLIGMAVGVDYSLFYLRRDREERAAGLAPDAALARTAATSGQAVLISGATVLIAMAGMLFAGNPIFTSIGIGAMIMVAVAMVGSLTVLPALMAKLGDRLDRGRVPLVSNRSGGESRVWSAVLTPVLRHPWIAATASAGVLVALALPTATMQTQLPSFTDLPSSLSIVESYERMQKAFPGAQTPAVVVVRAPDVEARPVQRALIDMELRALASGEMRQPMQMQINPRQTVATVSIPLAGSGNDERSESALQTLREEIIPATVGQVSGVDVAVTGQTAGSFDFNEAMNARLPIVFGFVLALAFTLLLLTFRSIVIPIKAILLNLLSVAAAYGVLVLVFQNEWAESLLGFDSNGAIASWLPLFLFVLLFGLSMDYHIFILTRVKEFVDQGMPTADAVARGIRATAGTVTSAAIVMVAVFAIFASLSSLDIKQMGVGLAAAVLIDATIVRAVLLPASMKLLGKWNWYLPRWLDWLPSLSPEGAPLPPPTAVAQPGLAAPAAEAIASADAASSDERIDVVARGDRVDVRVHGEITHDTVGQLGRRLREAEASRPATLVLDLREVRFMDSTGLTELVRAHHRARSAGRRLILVKRAGPIERILEISGLAGEFETATDVPPKADGLAVTERGDFR